jgi:hypothetical protein
VRLPAAACPASLHQAGHNQKEGSQPNAVHRHHTQYRQPTRCISDGCPGRGHEITEFMHHCSTKWGYHLLGLKAGLEGGQATPFPDDIHLSANWP